VSLSIRLLHIKAKYTSSPLPRDPRGGHTIGLTGGRGASGTLPPPRQGYSRRPSMGSVNVSFFSNLIFSGQHSNPPAVCIPVCLSMLVCASGALPLVITPNIVFPLTPSHHIGGCVPYTVASILPLCPCHQPTGPPDFLLPDLPTYLPTHLSGVGEFWAVKSSNGKRSFKDLYEIIFIS